MLSYFARRSLQMGETIDADIPLVSITLFCVPEKREGKT